MMIFDISSKPHKADDKRKLHREREREIVLEHTHLTHAKMQGITSQNNTFNVVKNTLKDGRVTAEKSLITNTCPNSTITINSFFSFCCLGYHWWYSWERSSVHRARVHPVVPVTAPQPARCSHVYITWPTWNQTTAVAHCNAECVTFCCRW